MKTEIKRLRDGGRIPFELMMLADPDMETVREYVARGEVYVLEADGVAIGSYVLIRTRPMTVELVNLAVEECYQNQGYGKMLLRHSVEIAKKTGAKIMELGTGNSSIGQMFLYQKCGFRIVGVDLDFFSTHYPGKIMENGIWCRDMVRMKMELE